MIWQCRWVNGGSGMIAAGAGQGRSGGRPDAIALNTPLALANYLLDLEEGQTPDRVIIRGGFRAARRAITPLMQLAVQRPAGPVQPPATRPRVQQVRGVSGSSSVLAGPGPRQTGAGQRDPSSTLFSFTSPVRMFELPEFWRAPRTIEQAGVVSVLRVASHHTLGSG